MDYLDKLKDTFSIISKSMYDFFPKELTFWSVLFYILMFYILAFIILNIYVYMNDLEYEIDCKNTKCINIKKRESNKKMDHVDDSNSKDNNDNHNL